MYYNKEEKKPLDKKICLRIDNELLEKFKKYTPQYQVKIKDLIQEYVSKCEAIQNRETYARNSYYKRDV